MEEVQRRCRGISLRFYFFLPAVVARCVKKLNDAPPSHFQETTASLPFYHRLYCVSPLINVWIVVAVASIRIASHHSR